MAMIMNATKTKDYVVFILAAIDTIKREKKKKNRALGIFFLL